MEQAQTLRLAVIGVVFFLAAAVLFDLTYVAASTDFWFHQDPDAGVFLLVLDALNLVAIYGALRRRTWSYVAAIVLALFIVAPTLHAVFVLGVQISGPAGVIYTVTMIVIRLMIAFFAAGALVLRR